MRKILLLPMILISTTCHAKTTSYNITNRLNDVAMQKHPMLAKQAFAPVKSLDGKHVFLETNLCYDQRSLAVKCDPSKEGVKRKKIENCSEYWANMNNINHASNVDYQIEGNFIKSCNILKLRLNEKPVMISAVMGVKVASLSLLKEILASDLCGKHNAEKVGKTVFELMTKKEKKSININKRSKTISFTFQDEWYTLQEIDRGNFDNTGNESILVYQEKGPIGGTKVEFSTILLKRTRSKAYTPLEIVVVGS